MVNRINHGGRFIPPAVVNNDFLRRASKVVRRGKPFSRSGRLGGRPRRLTVAGKRGARHGAHFGHAAQIDSCSSEFLQHVLLPILRQQLPVIDKSESFVSSLFR